MAQHYRFAFDFLKRYAFERTAQLQQALWSEPEAFLSWLWQQSAGSAESLDGSSLSVRTFRHQGGDVALITLPEPAEPPEAYFVLIAFGASPPDYYSLEMADPAIGGFATVLGRWHPDRRENLGEGGPIPPDPDMFVDRALALVDKRSDG